MKKTHCKVPDERLTELPEWHHMMTTQRDAMNVLSGFQRKVAAITSVRASIEQLVRWDKAWDEMESAGDRAPFFMRLDEERCWIEVTAGKLRGDCFWRACPVKAIRVLYERLPPYDAADVSYKVARYFCAIGGNDELASI